MRQVLSNHKEVCHFWANQVQSSGKSGNVFFDGPTIYSYGSHFPMATLIDDVAVFTTERYSTTTAKHLSEARYAANHLKQIFVVHPLDKAIDQVKETESQIAALLGKASRARKNKDWYIKEAMSKAENFNTFATLKKESVRITTGFNAADLKTLLAEFAEDDRKRDAAEKRRVDHEQKKQRAAWRAGRGNFCNGSMMLRITGDEVHTSQGARIPVDAAKALWPIIERVRSNGTKGDYETGLDLGNYRLTKIRRDGSILVGCHDIPYAELALIAAQLGLIT